MDSLTIQSVGQLFDLLKTYRNTSKWKFRGQSDARWDLKPKAGRLPLSKRNDREMFRHWKRRATSFLLEKSYSEFDLLAIAQHHGLATRLLDWSYNPLVAIFFACKENIEVDVCLFCYKPISVFVSEDLTSAFEELDEGVIFIQPSGSSPRLNNQFGYFSLHNPPSTDLMEGIDKDNLQMVTVPARLKREITFTLNQYGISHLTLFPDLEGLTTHLNWFYENYEYWTGN